MSEEVNTQAPGEAGGAAGQADGTPINPLAAQSLMTQRGEEGEQGPAPTQPDPEVPGAREPDSEPNDGSDTEATPSTLKEMIGDELMQDPASRIAATTLQELCQDIDVARAFGKAYEYDDASRIDLAYLQDKLGADKAQRVLETAEFLMTYADTVAARVEQDLYSSVEGGREGLEQAAAIFNQVADTATKEMVRDLLDSGDIRYMKHAAKLMQEHAAKAGGAYRHVPAPVFGAAQQAPMTRAEYIQAIQNPNLTEQEYQTLRARFAAGRTK